MKKSILLSILFTLLSCNNRNQISLIESYVCTSDGITSDLNFKIIKLIEIAPITVTDSMIFYLTGEIPQKYVWHGDSILFTIRDESNELIDSLITKSYITNEMDFWVKHKSDGERLLDEAKSNLTNFEREFGYQSNTFTTTMRDMQQSSIENMSESIQIIEGIIDTLALAHKYSKLKSDKILLRAFDGTYAIFNPLLKVKQTMTQTFYFDNDLTKIFYSQLKK